MASNNDVPHLYQQLWADSCAALAAGDVEIDQYLAAPGSDRRRGMTLLLRPSAAIRTQIAALLDRLRALEPDQYYYRADELHVTILSLILATEQFDQRQIPLALYQDLASELCASTSAFQLRFSGITASRAAVMIQGFAAHDQLNQLRDRIRARFRQAGIGAGLDLRYHTVTAHSTAIRFCAPLRDPQRFAAALADARQEDFGTMCVERAELTLNDWYMSRDRVELLAACPLLPGAQA